MTGRGWGGIAAPAIGALLAALVLAPIASADPGDAVGDVVGGAGLATTGVAVVPTSELPAPPRVSAASYVVADPDTGEVLAARNPHGRFLPASTVKILTAVTLLPRLDPKARYEVRFEDVAIEGSKVGIVPSGQYTIDSLMQAMLVVSGNDASVSLANAAGGVESTVALMNAEARRLRALDTTVHNPSGLDAKGQVTSAYDLALITREGLRNPLFTKYVGTIRSRIPTPDGGYFEIYNHNKLLPRYPGMLGVKTGYTAKARHSYVGAARRGERAILISLLRAENTYDDAIALLDWGFLVAGRLEPIGVLVAPEHPGLPVREARAVAARQVAAPPGTGDRPEALRVTPASTRTRFPVPIPVAAPAALMVAVVLRRRQVVRRRRRRGYSPSPLKLHLPVR